MHLDGELRLTVGQASFAGVKAENEDSIGIRIPEGNQLTTKGACVVIADGVSAAEAGKEASDTCVTNFLSDYFSTPDTWTVKKSAHQVLIALNRWLYGQGQRFIHAEKGYVSTLSIAVFKSRTAHLFHVGDSRIYRLRNGDLEQLTHDHATRINRESSYLTRAMGLDVNLDVDYHAVDIELGDIYLLTTDGVHDFVRDRDMREVVVAVEEDFEKQCNQLIAIALENQSGDNLSCQIVRVEQLPSENSGDAYNKLTALPFPPNLEVGMKLDGYRVDELIHASNRSQLYRVTDIDSGRRCVMKTPSVNYEEDAAYIERFIMEEWIGSRIHNSAIVSVVESKRPKTFLYYLTDSIEGPTVGQWAKNLPDTAVAEVVAMLAKIGRGVTALHRKETLHQDIKPDNIVVDSGGSPKIIDFGSCYVGGIEEIASPIARDKVLGTAAYSAPEHVLGRKAGVQADIFSLAVLAFEMLTGKLPFDAKLENCHSLQAYSKLKYIPSYSYNPHIPIWVDGALAKAMSISPELRYRDAAEFIYDLQHPNADFLKVKFSPMMQRNPILFWQVTAGLLFAAEILTLFFYR